ncbi:DNA-binding transcriptional regulator, MarR family [Chitinophaga costaii]|uniref:DNA-binding transcriptional regulator, MarR family n=1 Tax=Chitinophaga costaii TaxID=1335309 RepID=A0A1C4F7D3_9BACT|nr:MarR family transcriptional regulator [Chitinophaga costaii]PUZ21210.1 MarR family transcriptional regulator [Chitinophaga costaii]SCC51928.1 DNA-binding transcriptional regulator, MarR family [Chitinophaga costaii]
MQNLTLEDHLCFTIYALSRQFTCVYRPALDALGITYPQYLVMVLLWEQDGRSVKDLGARLYLDSGTLTPLLKRLEEKQLLHRQRDTTDERVVLVHLTAAGKALQEQAPTVTGALQDKMNLSLDQINALRGQLSTLLHSLEPTY